MNLNEIELRNEIISKLGCSSGVLKKSGSLIYLDKHTLKTPQEVESLPKILKGVIGFKDTFNSDKVQTLKLVFETFEGRIQILCDQEGEFACLDTESTWDMCRIQEEKILLRSWIQIKTL